MSPIALSLNLLLAVLLLGALAVGFRLERRLKALRDSHKGFAEAVGDLDRAAARAETGLANLRTATDEALELLVGRIEKARDLAVKLDQLVARGQTVAEQARAAASARPSDSRSMHAAAEGLRREASRAERLAAALGPQDQAPSRGEAPSSRPTPAKAAPPNDAEAAAEAVVENLVLKLTRHDQLSARPSPRAERRDAGRPDLRLAARLEPRPAPRPRSSVDEDLFDAPAASGRAGPGGRS
jgi:hypothetical protein